MDETTDETSCQTVDPWQPLPSAPSLPLALPKLAQSNCFQLPLESDSYLSMIESKLNRLKGLNSKKEPVAKDMINSLDQVRLCHMRMLTDVDFSSPYIRNSDYVDDSVSSPTIVDILKRKIAPEKQALNEEELKKLVDNDELHLTASVLEQTLGLMPPSNSAGSNADTVTMVAAETDPSVNNNGDI